MHAPDWDGFYRSGRYRDAWELDGPAPELAAYLDALGEGAGRVAVDLGCGTGGDCLLLARRGFRAHGVDISAAAVEMARGRAESEGVEISWHRADVLALPLDAGTADLVTDRGCLHHIPEEERGTYAAEVHRILRPGGRLFLRGCRVRQIPFVPVTEESIRRHFAPERWEVGPVEPLDLVTDRGAIPAHQCSLVRR
jgi:SAM-dependent methyltransferase